MNGFNHLDELRGAFKGTAWRQSAIPFALTVLLALIAAPARADSGDVAIDQVYADGPLAVRLTLDHTKITTPGQVRLSFIFTFEEGVEVQPPEFERTMAGFLVVSQEQCDPTTIRGVTTFAVQLVLESSLPGRSKLGPFELRYRDTRASAADANVHTIRTDPIDVEVVSGLADVAGPVEVPTPMWRVVVVWAVLVIVGIAFVWFVVARIRIISQRRMSVKEPVRVAADEWAIKELDTLAAAFGQERFSLKDYHFRVNATLRGYIELRFGIKAGEQTSHELLAAVQREASFEPKHRELLDRFVRACDPVKYAAQEATSDAAAWLDRTAREFVDETTVRDSSADVSNQGAQRADT